MTFGYYVPPREAGGDGTYFYSGNGIPDRLQLNRAALIFHEPLDAISLIGAAVIVGAGLVVMARERIKKITAVAEPTLPGKE